MIKANVLIVEDEFIVVKDIETRLKNLGYGNTYSATSGEKAIEEATRKKPDLVIMDIKLKGKIDGIDAAEKIRLRLNIPVIYLTAYADDDTLRRARITEPYGYILKPFRDTELHSNIQMALYKHNAEKEAKISSDKLKRIIDGVDDMILSVDKDGKITNWNSMMAAKTGFSKTEMLFKNIFKDSRDNPSAELAPLWQLVRNTLKSRKSCLLEQEIKDKHGNRLVLLCHTSPISNDADSIESIVLISRDISNEKNIHEQIMPGKAYLVDSKSFESTGQMVRKLIKMGYGAICISRDEEASIGNKLQECKSIFLRGGGTSREAKSENFLFELLGKINAELKNNPNTLVLVDRLEYLSVNYGFDALAKFVYSLHDLIRPTKSIMVAGINHDCFSKQELSILKEEMEELSAKSENVQIDEKMISILQFISWENARNKSVPFSLISSEFNISRATTKNWLDGLQKKLLIRITKHGRVKNISITDKGKELIMNK